MRALRHRRTLSIVLLLALAMQGALAFAHTHAHTTRPAHAERLAARAMTYGLCRATPERPCPAPVRHDDTRCDLCLSIAAAGAAVFEPPPVLPPRERYLAAAPAPVAALLLGTATVHFQARAPPPVLG